MYQLLYVCNVSNETKALDILKLEIYQTAFHFERQIRGLFLFHSGLCLEFLEGDKEIVQEKYHRIKASPIHKNLILLLERQGEDSIFSKWDYQYQDGNKLDIKTVNEFLSWNRSFSSIDLNNETIMNLLDRFRSLMSREIGNANRDQSPVLGLITN